ncbi:hyalin-like [Amphiura filiformis]|uniref:hyalin-like n=1 Tax=Amphiura filiformis TaxID=82378 RepID=UPI003B20DD5C
MAYRLNTRITKLPINIFVLICVQVIVVKAVITCDFISWCGFTQGGDDDFDWKRISGATHSGNTGPSSDHTSGSGYYVYIETSKPRQPGDTARLLSPTITATAGYQDCTVRFWYHMYGVHIGALNIYTKSAGSGGSVGNQQWTLSGNQGNMWSEASFTFGPQSDFQVVFEGVRGPDYKGDISLDDIYISSCVDTEIPVINDCPDNIRTTTELGTSEKSVSWTEPRVTDRSGTPRKTESHQPGSEFPVGVTNVRYTFTDNANNVAYCTFSITVETVDTIRPQVTGCPNNIQTTIELGTPTKSVTWAEPTATDLSGTPTRTRTHQPGTAFAIGVTDVRYTFEDTANNVATCSFSVTVETVDTTAPQIDGCPDNVRTTTELGTTRKIVTWIEPTSTDLSGIPQRTRSYQPGIEFPVGVTDVRYIFTDAANNVATCTFSVTLEIVDTTPPHVNQCPVDFASLAGKHVSWTDPTASDLSNVIWTSSVSPGTYITATTPVVYTFTDSSGNVAYCNFTITVFQDTTPPTIINCPGDIITAAELGTSSTTVSWRKPSATDESGRVILADFTHVSGQPFPIGTTIVGYTFADDSYNFAHCNFSVKVETVDTTPPAISNCPSDIVQNIELGTNSTPVFWTVPTATDASGNVRLLSQSHVPGSNFISGRTTVTYTFRDDSSNDAYCSFVVQVNQDDTVPPAILSCPSDIDENTELGTHSIRIYWSTPIATDMSGNVSIVSQTHSPGDRFSDGIHIVNYRFTDGNGNEASCSFQVFIQEGEGFLCNIIYV